MDGDLARRAQRLGRLAVGANLEGDFPLVKVMRLTEPAFARLEGAVIAYLWQSLSQAFPHRAFTPSRTMLSDYASAVQQLPNRTPNGLLLPRRETFLAFNLIHQALGGIFADLGLLDRLAKIQLPCNVRIVHGGSDQAIDARPYASAKMHSDVWAGEPLSAVLFNIPVLGDPRAVSIAFFEPREFPERLRHRLADYDEGREVQSQSTEYPLATSLGTIYMSDVLALHQTIKRAPVLRLSLDFRAIVRDLLPDESDDCSSSYAHYVSSAEWETAGRTTILCSSDPFDAFQRRKDGEQIPSTAFSTVRIDGSSY